MDTLATRPPREIALFGIYMPPLLVAALLGCASTWVTSIVLNRTGLSRHFSPPLVAQLAMVAIYTSLYASLLIPS